MKDMKNRCYRFENVEIDVQNLRVMVGSEIRALEPKSFRLLLFLIENPGRAITQIRKALDDDPKAPKYIETVSAVGYRFVADCKEEIREQGEEATQVPGNSGAPAGNPNRGSPSSPG
jgi:DNA-binding winged helix-turn-helix (wHTH) protein